MAYSPPRKPVGRGFKTTATDFYTVLFGEQNGKYRDTTNFNWKRF